MRLACALCMTLIWGCTPDGDTGKGADGGSGDDTASGGGSGDDWRASGSGIAFFADGSEDNSLFRLQLNHCQPPRDGESYYGWVSKDGADQESLGEIVVNGDTVDFSSDIGTNAIIGGYNHFEAWASKDSDIGTGEMLWEGDVDTTVYSVIQRLLIESPDTPDGQGSLRTMESELETLATAAKDLKDASPDIGDLKAQAEAIANGLQEPADDIDGDGDVSILDDFIAIRGENSEHEGGLVGLVDADLQAVAAAIPPGTPIRDYVDDGYDGLDVVYLWSHDAWSKAAVAANSAAEETGDAKLAAAISSMDTAITGVDTNVDGIIDVPTEGGLDRLVYWISLMAYMDVKTP